jgi:hypothetical protein
VKKLLLAICLATSACAAPLSISAPAPLAATTVDEKTLIIALQTFDTTLTVIDRLVAAKIIVPGSPTALKLADSIHRAKIAFEAAVAAHKAANATNYAIAIGQAQNAIAEINLMLKGN